jgi:hypothetical protein
MRSGPEARDQIKYMRDKRPEKASGNQHFARVVQRGAQRQQQKCSRQQVGEQRAEWGAALRDLQICRQHDRLDRHQGKDEINHQPVAEQTTQSGGRTGHILERAVELNDLIVDRSRERYPSQINAHEPGRRFGKTAQENDQRQHRQP